MNQITENRLITEDNLEREIANLIEPILQNINYRLVRVKINQLNGKTLQIMAERLDGSLTIEDCEIINNALTDILDEKDLIKEAYNLEISSPGLDRLLVRKTDFDKYNNYLIKLELIEKLNNIKKLNCVILKSDENHIEVKIEPNLNPKLSEEIITKINYDNIKEAKLIITDELIKSSLSKNKQTKRDEI